MDKRVNARRRGGGFRSVGGDSVIRALAGAPTGQSDASTPVRALNQVRHHALLLDLNNFATFPTLAVGILIAALRNSGYEARLIVPLAHDVPAHEREHAEDIRHHVMRRAHLSTLPAFRLMRDRLRQLRYWWLRRPHRRVLRAVERALAEKPDVLLLSAYLQHFETVREIGKLARAAGTPMILGGPAFNLPETADAWRGVPGLTAIVGGEVDLVLPDIVAAVIAGDDLLRFAGVVLPDGRRSGPAPPLRELNLSPVPDFLDFPWDRYPVRIVPMMTGRGCQWARCLFCSDVVSASGRTYRTRSIDSIMHEMREQSRRHATQNFLFLDLKLNSSPSVFRGIAEQVQTAVPGAQWIGTVHVDGRKDNGLSRADLRAAAASGMRRVSFGLESGSQRLLNLMDKGSTVDGNSAFIRTASEAGISIRCTMFKGFPGETADDLEKTAAFLEAHSQWLDRIRFNDFSIQENTPIWNAVFADISAYPGIRVTGKSARHATARYVNVETCSPSYRRAKKRALAAVFAINRRPLRPEAQMFDGLM